jgi:hypothetical protein
MTPLFAKLQLKAPQVVHLLGAPAAFAAEAATIDGIRVEHGVPDGATVAFAIAFACTRAELDDHSATLVAAAGEDPLLWIAYPKGSSRRYRCEFNRDSGWDMLGAAGFEAVRQVAIDEDWTALRFRRVGRIPRLTRDAARASSVEGKARTRR